MSGARKITDFPLARATAPVMRHRKTAKLYFTVFAICAALSLLAVHIAPAKPTLGYRVIGMAFAGGMNIAITMLIYHATFIVKALMGNPK